MRTGGTRVGNRCYIQAGTQISPSSRVARRLCCEASGTCLYREGCNRYTEPVPVAARGGELGAPGSCADHRTCSHVRNCRYEASRAQELTANPQYQAYLATQRINAEVED